MAQGAARLSEEKKAWVRQRLLKGLTPEKIMAEHEQLVINKKNAGVQLSRDDRVFGQDIANFAADFERSTFKLHPQDSESVRLWVMQHPELVLDYQQGVDRVGGLRQPFGVLVQTPWQLEQLVQHGHGKVLCMDATFGTNKWKVMICKPF